MIYQHVINAINNINNLAGICILSINSKLNNSKYIFMLYSTNYSILFNKYSQMIFHKIRYINCSNVLYF